MIDDRNKFTFTMTQGDFTNTMTFRADTWGEALENFQDFLRGCGYVFTGVFDLVEEEKIFINEVKEDSPDEWFTSQKYDGYIINEPDPLCDFGENSNDGIHYLADEIFEYPSDTMKEDFATPGSTRVDQDHKNQKWPFAPHNK